MSSTCTTRSTTWTTTATTTTNAACAAMRTSSSATSTTLITDSPTPRPSLSSTNGTLFRLYGPWAVVTGASAGIGRAFAVALAEAGLNVVLVARRRGLLDQVAKEIEHSYLVSTRVVVVDLRQPTAISTISNATSELEVGLVVQAAGSAVYGAFFKDDSVKHADVLSTNVLAPVMLSRELVAPMRRRGRGGCIFVGSTASVLIPFFATYAPSKRFLADFARLLSFELAPFGVDVLCVEPGLVHTQMARTMCSKIDVSKISPAALTPSEVARLSLERLMQRQGGRNVVWTPGAKARVSKIVTGLIPRRMRMQLLGKQLKCVMAAEELAALQ